MIVDRETNVILLYELFDSRQIFWRGVASDNNGDSCLFAIFEFAPDVRVIIFVKINGSGSVEFDSSRGIVRECSCFLLRIRREMIFDVFQIQREHIELLYEGNQLRAVEVAKSVTGQPQMNGRCFAFSWRLEDELEGVARRRECGCSECAGAKEIATGKSGFHF